MASAAAAAAPGGGAASGPVAAAIVHKLQEALQPVSLSVVNESHKHAGHSGNPSGAADAETHFRWGAQPAAAAGGGQARRSSA